MSAAPKQQIAACAPSVGTEPSSASLSDSSSIPLIPPVPPFLPLNEPPSCYAKHPKAPVRTPLSADAIANRFPTLPFSSGYASGLFSFAWEGGVAAAYTLLEVNEDDEEKKLIDTLWQCALDEFHAMVGASTLEASVRLGAILVIACSRALADSRPISPFSSLVRLLYTHQLLEGLRCIQLPLPRAPDSGSTRRKPLFLLSPILLDWTFPTKSGKTTPGSAATHGYIVVGDEHRGVALENWGAIVHLSEVGLDPKRLANVDGGKLLSGDWLQLHNLDLKSLPALAERGFMLISRKLLEHANSKDPSKSETRKKRTPVSEDKKTSKELIKARAELAAQEQRIKKLERENAGLTKALDEAKLQLSKATEREAVNDAAVQTLPLSQPNLRLPPEPFPSIEPLLSSPFIEDTHSETDNGPPTCGASKEDRKTSRHLRAEVERTKDRISTVESSVAVDLAPSPTPSHPSATSRPANTPFNLSDPAGVALPPPRLSSKTTSPASYATLLLSSQLKRTTAKLAEQRRENVELLLLLTRCEGQELLSSA
ncbi:hypothetical protein JCM10213v2_007850 [Rhodosporidiobolus nylandii]